MKQSAKQFFRTILRGLAAISIFSLAIGSSAAAVAADKPEAQSMVDKSKGTLVDLTNDALFSWLNGYLKNARGVIIFPQIIKGGFLLGGSGGPGYSWCATRRPEPGAIRRSIPWDR